MVSEFGVSTVATVYGARCCMYLSVIAAFLCVVFSSQGISTARFRVMLLLGKLEDQCNFYLVYRAFP